MNKAIDEIVTLTNSIKLEEAHIKILEEERIQKPDKISANHHTFIQATSLGIRADARSRIDELNRLNIACQLEHPLPSQANTGELPISPAKQKQSIRLAVTVMSLGSMSRMVDIHFAENGSACSIEELKRVVQLELKNHPKICQAHVGKSVADSICLNMGGIKISSTDFDESVDALRISVESRLNSTFNACTTNVSSAPLDSSSLNVQQSLQPTPVMSDPVSLPFVGDCEYEVDQQQSFADILADTFFLNEVDERYLFGNSIFAEEKTGESMTMPTVATITNSNDNVQDDAQDNAKKQDTSRKKLRS